MLTRRLSIVASIANNLVRETSKADNTSSVCVEIRGDATAPC